MRYLVTGCAGFIGSHLTESLLSSGHQVIGVDCFNDNYGRPQKLGNLAHAQSWDNFEFVPIDLSRGDLGDVVAGCDAIFHLAAEPGVRSSWGQRFERYVQNNVVATQHLLEALHEQPRRRFVYASSSSVYGDATSFPTAEDEVTRPLSPYGMTKLGGEQLCHIYHQNHGIDAVALRYFTVFGPRQRPDMAFNIFCRAALRDEPLVVFGDGNQSRDFTFVSDVVAATRAAAEPAAPSGGVYNIGGGTPATLREALGLIGDFVGRPLRVTYRDREHGDVRDTAADTTRARQDLGFAPETSLPDGLHAEFEWVRESLG